MNNKIGLVLVMLGLSTALYAQTGKTTKPKSKKAKTETAKSKTAKDKAAVKPVKQETAYQKLFKDKKVKTEKGMITLHKIEGKVYFEFPVKLLEKPMLVGSVAESVSNSNDAVAGQQGRAPLSIYFTQIDSIIYIKRAIYATTTDKSDAGLKRALEKNNIGPIIASFKILAVSPDSTAVVFEPTEFFVSGTTSMDPFIAPGGLSGRSTSFKSDKSMLGDIAAFSDNVSVTSYLSYGISGTFFGFVTETDRPATITMKRTLMLLPETPMRPRMNDPRIGIAFTKQQVFSGADNGIKEQFFANRWRLVPADEAAFKRGELVAPLKPVVFYIDDEFPAQWIPYIKTGLENWNRAFEKIGYKQALVVKMYPKDDPEFDANNIKYNCVKYAPAASQSSMGPAWVDPRSGEILNASIYIYHGLVDKLTQDLFLQAAAADKRARTTNMPASMIGEVLQYVVAQEAGHCLGLLSNMGASAAIPVDSLRSPSFTQKYGITASVMDDARINFVAQPGDAEKGVRMTQQNLGVYDYHAIKWLYTPIFTAATAAEEVPVLDRWISEKITDPMFRFSKKQNAANDPNAQADDLGDDQLKATDYAFDNLKYVLANMDSWIDKEDKDYSFRRVTNFAIINIQFYWYLTHVLTNIGGVYQYEKYQGDPFPAYQSVPKDVQKRSVLYILNLLENISWLNNPQAEQHLDGINGDAGDYMRRILFPFVMRWVAYIGLSEAKATDNPYTQRECIADIFDQVWGSTIAGKTPTPAKLSMQSALVQLLISNSTVLNTPGADAKAGTGLADDQIALQQWYAAAGRTFVNPDEVSGFGPSAKVGFQSGDISHVYYEWLLQNKEILEKAVKKHKGDVKAKYEYLLLQINNALKAA